MTKKHFIALADMIREYNEHPRSVGTQFTHTQLLVLADFCASTNSNFNRDRWLGHIAGKCGPNGGKR